MANDLDFWHSSIHDDPREHERLLNILLRNIPRQTGRLHDQIRLELEHEHLTNANIHQYRNLMLEKYVIHQRNNFGIRGAYPTATFIDEANEYYLNTVSATLGIPKRFLTTDIRTISVWNLNKFDPLLHDIETLCNFRGRHNFHPTDIELDVIRAMVAASIPAVTISISVYICAVCKSNVNNKLKFPCNSCKLIYKMPISSLYKPIDSICKFCRKELISDVIHKDKIIKVERSDVIL